MSDARPGQHELLLRLATPAITLLLSLLSINVALVGSWDDDAIYLSTAQSLAAGDGMRAAVLPGAPAVTKYPPVYPLLLAGLIKLGLSPARDASLWWALALNGVFYAGAVYLTVNVLLPRLGATMWQRWSALALLATSAPLLRVVGSPLSESLFTLLMVVQSIALVSSRWASLGVCVAFGTLTRTVNLPVALALAAYAAARRQWRTLAFVGGAVVIAGIALLAFRAVAADDAAAPAQHYYAGYASHVGYYTQVRAQSGTAAMLGRAGEVAIANTSTGLHALKELVYPRLFIDPTGEPAAGSLGFVERTLGFMLLLVSVIGLACHRAARPLLVIVGAYLLVFLFWTWPMSIRFWTPIYPLLVIGLALAGGRFGRPARLVLITLAVTSILLNVAVLTIELRPTHPAAPTAPDDPLTADFDASRRWLEINLSASRGDVLLAGFDAQWLVRQVRVPGQWLDTMLDTEAFYDRMLGVGPKRDAAQLSERLWSAVAELRAAMPEDARLALVASVAMRPDMRQVLEQWSSSGRIERVSAADSMTPIYLVPR